MPLLTTSGISSKSSRTVRTYIVSEHDNYIDNRKNIPFLNSPYGSTQKKLKKIILAIPKQKSMIKIRTNQFLGLFSIFSIVLY